MPRLADDEFERAKLEKKEARLQWKQRQQEAIDKRWPWQPLGDAPFEKMQGGAHDTTVVV